ncbi:hypothetical protein Trichorick_01431 (plasmid) [Candidatus Trichorickettsia mobilis]|uniref:Uncharacterized protein n=1 Tax=Candidatus Trichorickettsia mobilis TaxID=1346319 RepID=A0ABZ0UU01_9RICK|nr:hypothetical protein [Candidatus Trichorickettsia mobilis]WPY01518.1 hypothetical protein Trichorick_01431 [Candidatus Trichorickettsia mobilis]
MTGIKVSDYIRPLGISDVYPTHLDIFGKGGIHSVSSILGRDNITTERRSKGMFAFVEENNSFYSLLKGLDNQSWVKLFGLDQDNNLDFQIFCPKGYTLVGDNNQIARPSPILIDIRQDIIDLRRNVDKLDVLGKLDHNRIWVGDYTNRPEERLQIGVVNLPTLGAALFPEPTGLLEIAIPNPTFNHLSASDWIMSGPWLPQIFAGFVDTDLSSPLTKVSSSLAMTQIRTAKNFKLFDNSAFIVANKTVSFFWDNPAYLIADIDPKLKAVMELYDLGTTYTFTKAQSLGELESGLLKNTVDNHIGTLSKAIPGTDYVELTDIPIGPLVVYNQDKFISPTSFKTRKNKPNEFGEPTPNVLNILEGPLAIFTKLALTALETGLLVKIGLSGELIGATKGTDYVTPNEIGDINTKLDKLALLVKLLIGVKVTTDIVDITLDQAKNLNKVVKTIVGVKDAVDMVDVTFNQANALTTAVKNAVGVAETAEIVDLTAKAATVATNAASLVEIEAQIAALAGVQTLTALGTILGFVFTVFGGYEYGQYIRGQTLNVKNTWKAADLNDEGHNAVGDFEFRYPSGYSSDDRGHGTLWFDSRGRSSSHRSSAGLRLFAWDSGADHMGSDDPLAPLHIGIFGYQNKYHVAPRANPTPIYKGFIFESDFDNDNGGIFGDNPNYRFPKRFGLYDVTRTISTFFTQSWGWDSKNTIFEYDYQNFNFEKPVKFNKNIILPIIKKADIPLNPPLGMVLLVEF